jgi:hypothetical protein
MLVDGKPVNNYAPVDPGNRNVTNGRGGGIEWTIKDGVPYHVPALLEETRGLVENGRAQLRGKGTATPQ